MAKKILTELEGTGKLNQNHEDSMPNPAWHPEATTYMHYRMGLQMASLPDKPAISPMGPIGDHPFSAGYSDEDQEIINRAAKLCGFTPRKLGKTHSSESEDTHKISPVNHNSGVHIRKRHWKKD